MKRFILVFCLILAFFSLNVDMGYADAWERNSTLENLPIEEPINKEVSSFILDDELHILLGNSFSFKWNETSWIYDSDKLVGLNFNYFNPPTFFNIDTQLYGFHSCVSDSELYCGTIWNGTQWINNSTIVSGLRTSDTISLGSSFEYNDELYFIETRNVGFYAYFYGYKWNGSTWVSNSIILSGLPSSIGGVSTSLVSISAFTIQNTPYLLLHESRGFDWYDSSYKWNGTRWNGDIQYLQENNVPTTWYNTLQISADKVLLFVTSYATQFDVYETPDIPESCVPAYAWQTNTSLLTGLPSDANAIKSTTYVKDGNIYSMFSFSQSGVINVHEWSGSTWALNSSLNDGLSPIGTYDTYPSPSVYFWSGWKTIIGSSNGNFYGYYWNDTEWIYSSTITQGLPNMISYSAPTVFEIDGNLYLIAGNGGGDLFGFKLVGTYWVSYNAILDGLSDASASASLSAYEYNSSLYLVYGDSTGNVENYQYVNGYWEELDIEGDSISLTFDIDDSTPSVYLDGSVPNMLVGSDNGTWNAYTLGIEGYEENLSVGEWSVCNSSSQQSRTTMDVCNLIETIEVQSCCYEIITVSEWSECNIFGKQYRTTDNNCGELTTEEQVCVYTPENESCIPDLQCGEWSDCNAMNKSFRVCDNGCDPAENEEQSCVYIPNPICVPVMECTDWSDCNPSNESLRTCYDGGNTPACVDNITETIFCEYEEPICTPDVTCGLWSFCNPYSNLKTRTCVDATPTCQGTYEESMVCYLEAPTDLIWHGNSLITDGLSEDGVEYVPSAFNFNSVIYVSYAYSTSGIIEFYDWRTDFDTWYSNPLFDTGLSSVGTYEQNPKPAYFEWEGSLRTIVGSAEGDFYGYTWNGSSWNRDYWIETGLPTGGYYRTAPTIFFKDGQHRMIFGDSNGAFTGYKWNGSIWSIDVILESNLPNVGQHSTPSVFYYGYFWYLTTGDLIGNNNNFRWDASQDKWLTVSSLDDSIVDVGSFTAPTTFFKDDILYMLSGTLEGELYGYDLRNESCVPEVTCGSWSACKSDNTQSRTCDDGCGTITIEEQSCTYVAPEIPNFICSSWTDCDSSSLQYRTCIDDNGYEPTYTENQSCVYEEIVEYEWVIDNSIISNLPQDDLKLTTTAYVQNGTLRAMFSFASSGVINVHEWSDTFNRWALKNELNDGLSPVETYETNPAPASLFYWDGLWRTIIGSIDGSFYGYTWDGSEWYRDWWIVNGLTDISTRSTPDVFTYDGTISMIHGSVDGNFKAYTWDGSTWSSNTLLVANLGDAGVYSTPAIFEYEDGLYLVTGNAEGDFLNYKFLSEGWVSVDSMDESIASINGDSTPTTFLKDGIPYMISGSYDGDIYGYRLREIACVPDITCTQWTECFMELGVLKKQRICEDANNCVATTTEKVNCVTAIDVGDDFYSEDEPDAFYPVPIIITPSSETNSPNVNSQSITGFACFPNWYGYNDSYFEKMEYTIDGVTKTIYPADSKEPCGKGLDCAKPYGYIQTWDFVDDYFTQYDDYFTDVTVTCYGNGTTNSLTLNFESKEEDYCVLSEDSLSKECFAFGDKLSNHIYSSTDLNLKPTFAFDLDRIVGLDNVPDWQMYRLTTDTVNYFSNEIYINDAKDTFNKIEQKEGYQIIELFASPQAEAQVYFDFYTTDIYPKYFTLTDSVGQVQILIMFYNNEVYYFDGYSYKSLGDYALNTPYTVNIDFDVDNQLFKLGLNTWHLSIDDSFNVFSWQKIGSWQYESKIGTFITQFDDAKDIKYLAFTMMSELCNSDIDCSSTVGSQSSYSATTTTAPAFSDDWGFKQVQEHLHDTDGSYIRYFDDEQSSNIGISTINTWDGTGTGVFNSGSILSTVWKSEADGWFCYGTINKTIDIYARVDTASWVLQDTIIITPETAPQTYSVAIGIPFNQVKYEYTIDGGLCFGSSRGSIDVDSIKATNITVSSGGECRDIDWFTDTFTNTSGNIEWAFEKSINNSLFMLEWEDEIYTNLKLDTDVWTGGYCYSDMLIDNVETFNTRSTFYSSDEDSKKKIYTYAWIEKLGWNLAGNQGEISGETGAYVSNYYNWDVCTEDGREYNEGAWCVINVTVQVLWDIIIGSIYGNFLAFLIFLFLLMALSTFVIMIK